MTVYVQQDMFSNSRLGRELIKVLGAYGYSNVKAAIEGSPERSVIEGIFKQLLPLTFITVGELKGGDDIPYQSIDRAIRDLPLFSVDSLYYGSEANKRRKLEILLDSVTFQEANILHRIIKGNYDKDAFRRVLFPVSRRKKEA